MPTFLTLKQSRREGGGFDSTCALMRALRRVPPGEDESETALGLDGRRPLRPFRLSVLTTAEHEEKSVELESISPWVSYSKQVFKVSIGLPSLTIPTARHFWKRQYWHRFLLRLSTGQLLAAKHTYLAFFCTVRCREQKRFRYFSEQSLEMEYLPFGRCLTGWKCNMIP